MKSELLTMEKVQTSQIDYEFITAIFFRFFKILFRSDKRIKMVYINSSNYNSLGDDIIVLNYRFKNGIYYKVNGQSTEKFQMILHKNDISSVVDIVVYGLFSQKKYKFNIKE